jgi:hypothetical protein
MTTGSFALGWSPIQRFSAGAEAATARKIMQDKAKRGPLDLQKRDADLKERRYKSKRSQGSQIRPSFRGSGQVCGTLGKSKIGNGLAESRILGEFETE